MMDLSGKAITDLYPSRMLCGKRYDNDFPFASSSANLPHTCFEDVILVPLASWAFFVGLFAFLGLLFRSRHSSKHGRRALHPLVYRKRDGGLLVGGIGPSWTARWPKTATGFSILNSLLVIATLLMNILEIVRLYLADRGAGLLPFSLAAILLVIILMHVPLPVHARPVANALILVFWILSLVFTSVKLATLNRLRDIEPRARTEYLNSDQVLDVGVMVGLYGLEILVECARLFTSVRQDKQANEATLLDSHNATTTHDSTSQAKA